MLRDTVTGADMKIAPFRNARSLRCLVQQLCTVPMLASSAGDLLATLLRGCADAVPNVRLVAAQFLAEVVQAGHVPADRVASEVR